MTGLVFRLLMKSIVTISMLLCVFATGIYSQIPQFGSRQNLGEIENADIDEASGLAASRKNSGVLWTHNDSGDNARIFALDLQGRHVGEFKIENISNRDWEDLAIGPGPVEGEVYLYIADIGDNDYEHNNKYIYRIPEPGVNPAAEAIDTVLTGAETITFRYPGARYNAETLMLDPLTRDLYIVTKQSGSADVFRLPYPQSTTETMIAEHLITLDLYGGDFGTIVGGDISANGLEMLIKSYYQIFYRSRTDSTTSWQKVLQTEAVSVPYIAEPQGEAVCWAADGSGYYTLSEETLDMEADLYFYPRLNETGLQEPAETPERFVLNANYPNPFNLSTTLSYRLNETGKTSFEIYSITGELIRILVSSIKTPGEYSVHWDGCDNFGDPVASGVYLYRLQSGGFSQTRRMLLLK